MIESILRPVTIAIGNTNADCAKTQTYMAASPEVREKKVHQQYWEPTWSWSNRYVSCQQANQTSLARDQAEWKRLWEFSERMMEEKA